MSNTEYYGKKKISRKQNEILNKLTVNFIQIQNKARVTYRRSIAHHLLRIMACEIPILTAERSF